MLGIFTNRRFLVAIRRASIVFSMLVTLWLVTGSQSYAGLNISRAKYDAALAKWNRLQITDYEATIQTTNWGRWKIIVHVDDSDPSFPLAYWHKITHFERLDSMAANLQMYDVDFLTVGRLFDWIERSFYEHDHPYGHWYSPGYYAVEFDENMGYPRSYISINDYAIVETRIEDV